jgi:hypothetical protein
VTSIFPLGGPAGTRTGVDLNGWNLPATRIVVDDRDKAPGTYPISVRKDSHISNFVPFSVDNLPECLDQELPQGPARAQRVTPPIIVNGRILKPDTADTFSFEGKAGQQIVAEDMDRRLNSPLDSSLQLTDSAGKEIAFNDDNTDRGAGLTTHHADSYLTATLPKDGTYLLNLRDTQHKGGPEFGYRLRISPPMPDFALRAVPSTINARAGSKIPVTVYALRKDGFTGEIAISLKNAPPGFVLTDSKVPAKEDKLKLTLTAPAEPSPNPINIEFEGRASIDGREIVRAAVPADDRMQAFEYRHLVPSQEMCASVFGRPDTKKLTGRKRKVN